jgi:hypothetical protein
LTMLKCTSVQLESCNHSVLLLGADCKQMCPQYL